MSYRASGMWIEINSYLRAIQTGFSHTARAVCGLKSAISPSTVAIPSASYRASGTWIEIGVVVLAVNSIWSHRSSGAWIEILRDRG